MTEPLTQHPFRIDLDQQSVNAEALQVNAGAGDRAAAERVQRIYPDYRSGDELPLVDAQTVVANELGLEDWPRLAAHVARMDEARRGAESGQPNLDSDLHTLHIRCGSDLQDTLPAAGFGGDFLAWTDAVCQGALRPEADTAERAQFLYQSYARFMDGDAGTSRERIQAELDGQHQRLARAAADYGRVVLWFEHDSYDQAALVQVLAHFARRGAPAVLEMVTLDAFPGEARFIGLGQLPPEALQLLWGRRMPVTTDQLALGARAWDALCAPEPDDAAVLAADPGTASLPYLGRALRRHLQELPAVCNGLSMTQRLVLELLAVQDHTPGELFGALTRNKEPLPWLGDIMFLHILREMTQARRPVFAGWDGPETPGWPRERLTLTETGRQVLAGGIDWLALEPPARWLGGVRIAADDDRWRWDERSGNLTDKRSHA